MKKRPPLRPVFVLIPAAIACLLIAGFLAVGRNAPPAEALPPGATPSYAAHVAPILARRCAACHGAAGLGGFNAGSREALLRSGDHAPNLLPGDAQSPLLRLVRGEALPYAQPMPPGQPLSQAEIDTLTRWVLAGSPP